MDIYDLEQVSLERGLRRLLGYLLPLIHFMSTVINNPPGTTEGNGSSAIVLAVVVILLVALFLIFGLPRLSDRGDTNINVPDKIQIENR